VIGFDSETECFEPGYKAPRPVCWTFDSKNLPRKIVHANAAETTLKGLLSSGGLLVSLNTAYDTVVLFEHYPRLRGLLFDAYDNDRISCVKLREQLIDTAHGRFRGIFDDEGEWHQRGYSLFDLARRYLGKTLDKDTWRLRYGEFIDLPIIAWPQGAIDYALDDACDQRAIAEIQEQQKHLLSDQFNQARGQFALALTSARGLRTDPERVELFAGLAEERYRDLRKRLQGVGIVRPDRTKRDGTIEEGSADTAKAKEAMIKACEESGIKPILTKTGKVALGADACERVKGDPVIDDYTEFLTARKVLSNDCKMLREAVRIVHPSYDITKTGRTTCANPNIQNLRKDAGIRECFVPDPGYCFIDCDYPSLELFCIAEVCYRMFSFSALGEVLKADKDAHLMLAASKLGMTYEEAASRKKEPLVKEARQASKPVNFGNPGGLGAARSVALALKDYGVVITEEQAKADKKIWLRTYPEMQAHLGSASDLTKDTGFGGEVSLFTGQVTAGKTYSEIANERFQRLGADIAKSALYRVAKACLFDEMSPLFGSFPVAFVHDEIICESPVSKYRDAAKELAKIMCEAANAFLVHVPMKLTGNVKVESLAMSCWSKDAERIVNEQGELEIWQPK
jgi:DNA polymerase I